MKTKTKKTQVQRLAAAAAIAIALAGCAETVNNLPEGSSDEIRLRSGIVDVNTVSGTRAPYEVTTPTTAAPLTALVLTSQHATSFADADIYCNGTMTFTSANEVSYNKPVTAGSSTLPVPLADNFYVTALHPATGWDLATADGDASITFTGKEDVMLAARQTTSGDNIKAGTFPELEFKHQLTWLQLAFTGDETASTRIKVTSIKLVEVMGTTINNKATIKLSQATQTVAVSGTATEMACYVAGSDDTYTSQNYAVTETSTTPVAYVMAPPVTATAATTPATYEYTFEVAYLDDTTPATMQVSLDLRDTGGSTRYAGDTTGKSFKITFNFIGDQISATATVTAWDPAGDFVENI